MTTSTEQHEPHIASEGSTWQPAGSPTWPPPGGPPPQPSGPGGPAGGPDGRQAGVRNAIVAAVVAAAVATVVAVPVARATAPDDVVDPDDGTNVSVASDEETVPDVPDPAPIAQVAADVSPSVAFVQVAGQNGQGSGSAVIVDADGYLLTNAHVVDGAQRIEVTLPDGNRYAAALVGSDPMSDVAVLRIDATGLPALEIDPDVEVGETVIAIGSPFGLEGSVTSGIVSGVDRTLGGGQGGAALLGMIQTDAAINPGNSGGALVDTRGRLVGINTAIFSGSGTSSGVGFAIPAGTAMAVADQLIDTGTVTYAQIGISGSDVTPALAAAYDLSVEEGALVAEVLPGGGAEAAGLEEGDVIVGLDGEAVTSMAQLTALVRARAPGETVALAVDRDGDELEMEVLLGSAT